MAVVVAGTIQGKAGKPGKAGKAGKTGPGQTKPRLGTTGKPAKPKQGGLLIVAPGPWEGGMARPEVWKRGVARLKPWKRGMA